MTKTTTTETIEYDDKGQVTKRTVVTTTEDYHTTQWYTPWWTYPTTGPSYPTSTYPYITYTSNTLGNASTTSGTVTWLTNDNDDNDDDGQAGVSA